MIYEYGLSDLNDDLMNEDETKFDSLLMERWKHLQNTPGIFQYKMTKEDIRILKGRHNFIFQINPDRSTKRRTPGEFLSVKHEFDINKFNFNKISESEHLFELKKINKEGSSKDMMIINSSPICFSHSLLCPDITECLPQIVTEKSLVLIMEIIFLSSDRYLRIGFNSLCGLASVNHLHYHFLNFKHWLPVETIRCSHLVGPVYTLDDYPAKGFCLQIKSKHDISQMSSDLYKLTSYFTNENIAHNLYIMRGNAIDGSSDQVWRILVWARESIVGMKNLSELYLAMCEFSGHFPIKGEEIMATLTEDSVSEMMYQTTKEIYNNVLPDIVKIFS